MAADTVSLPASHRVFQRDAADSGIIRFSTPAPVEARLLQGRTEVLPWRMCSGILRNVPVGGPYALEVHDASGAAHHARGLLMGDLWVMAGQSNMDGYGKLINLEPPSPMVHCYYYDETWGIARDPLCWLNESIDPVHWLVPEADLARVRDADRRFRAEGAGMGLRFGKDLCKATGVPIGLIVCSHGGTSMDQWSPDLKSEGGRSLYGSMLRRVEACGGKVKGLIWYQGESDASAEAGPAYKDKMLRFINAVRRDLGSPKLPFILAQLSRFFVDENQFPWNWWNHIQQVQLDLAAEVPYTATAAAIDGTLSDAIHIDAVSQRRMGARFAELALVLAYGKKAPTALTPAKFACNGKTRNEVTVTYRNVRGTLRPAKGIQGFFVEQPSGERVGIEAATAGGTRVRLRLDRFLEPGARLWYGRGCGPVTNLGDALFAAPVFGPIELP